MIWLLVGGGAVMDFCQAGHLEAVKVLVQRGADMDIRNSGGRSAMTEAMMRSHDAVCDFLIESQNPGSSNPFILEHTRTHTQPSTSLSFPSFFFLKSQ